MNRLLGGLNVDTSPRRDMDAKNRRSTRIVQAVPLTVTGVDALGRPFQERTSTLIINCQGCRYQSKHYVLKNMWLTFEVPHPEAGQPPRSVRARVTWVLRPRTVRELFQIGAELEVSGNIWGVAFPPADWAAFLEGGHAEVPPRFVAPIIAPLEESASQNVSESVAPEAHAAQRTSEHEREAAAHGEDNLRMMPSPGAAAADESLLLARQMGRLVNEARQQLQETVHTQASQAVSAEIGSVLLSVERHLREAAEKSVRDAAATHGEEILRVALENISRGEIERLSSRWSQEADRHLQAGIGRLTAEIDQIEARRRDELAATVNSRFDQAQTEIENATRALAAESAAAQARLEQWRVDAEETSTATLRRWTELAESSTAQAQERMTELEAAAARVSELMAAATTEAEAGWRGRIETDVASANARLHERMESSIESAARQVADRLARNSEASAHELERHIAQRIEALGRTFTEATAEAESALGTLRTSLSKETGRAHAAVAQLHEASVQIENHGATLDVMRQEAVDQLQRSGAALVESHSEELNRRAEAIADSVVQRLEPGLIAAGRQLLSTLARDIEQQLAPQLDRAGAALRELEAGSARAEEAARAHEARLHEISERSLDDASARAAEILKGFDARFQETGAATHTRLLAELDAKATDTTHTAFESIFKTAEWYEKKVQTQMQATLEKGLAQAGEALRVKAGELSGLFATELDHFTRSYVEHAKEQLDEQARAAAMRTREAAQEASDAVAAGFSERAAKIAAEQYQHLAAQSVHAQEHFAERLNLQQAEAQSKLDDAARQTAAQFRAEIENESDESLGKARQKLDSQAETLTESWRSARASEVQQVELDLARMGNRAVEDYKQRLENTSDTWVLASVTKLNQHSQNLIEQLASASEDRIRAACFGIFAEIGESLRTKVLQAPDPDPQAHADAAPKQDAPSVTDWPPAPGRTQSNG
ncbi:MAG: hypothetical protein WBF35_15270 [Candidatus Acidiferrales bacterium]